MSDITERLRALSRCAHDDLSIGDEAADEIDRLRALLRDVARTAPYVNAETRDAILDYLDAAEGAS